MAESEQPGMQAVDPFLGDREWLERQPGVQPWATGCQRLGEQMERWLSAYTPRFCSSALSVDDPRRSGFQRRLWGCWSHYWKQRLKPPGAGQADGFELASRLTSWGDAGHDLVRDVILAEAIVQGDHQALGCLLEEQGPSLAAIARGVHPQDGEDAWQVVQSRLCPLGDRPSVLGAYRGVAPLFGYLRTIVIREAAHGFRRRGAVPLPAAMDVADPRSCERFDAADLPDCQRLLSGVLRSALDSLDAREATAFYFHVVQGQTQAAVARELAYRHKGSVSQLLKKATGKLLAAAERAQAAAGRDREAIEHCLELIFQGRAWQDLITLLSGTLGELQGAGTRP